MLYAQFRLSLHPHRVYAVCILSPIYNLVVTIRLFETIIFFNSFIFYYINIQFVKFQIINLGVIHFWNFTDLSIFYQIYIPHGHILLYVRALGIVYPQLRLHHCVTNWFANPILLVLSYKCRLYLHRTFSV